jgi:hypothetical protein
MNTVRGACRNCQRVWAWTPRRGVLRVLFHEAFCPNCGGELRRVDVAAKRSYVEVAAAPLDATAAAPVRTARARAS